MIEALPRIDAILGIIECCAEAFLKLFSAPQYVDFMRYYVRNSHAAGAVVKSWPRHPALSSSTCVPT